MSDNKEKTVSLLYAYAYNEQNDVFTVRGIVQEVTEYTPRPISTVPQGLIEQMLTEFVGNSGLNPANLIPTLSCAEDGSAIIVDFYNRVFSTDQVKEIMNGKFVSKPRRAKKPFVHKIIPSSRKKRFLR